MTTEETILKTLVESDIVKLCALVLILCAVSLVLIVRSNNKVLNRQMENESNRDQIDAENLVETKRSNRKLEELIDKLITKEDERFIKISDGLVTLSDGLVTLHENQEEIKQGVQDMSNKDMITALENIEQLLKILIANQDANNKAILRMEQMLIAPSPAEPLSGDKTEKLAPATMTLKQEKELKADATIDKIDNSKNKE